MLSEGMEYWKASSKVKIAVVCTSLKKKKKKCSFAFECNAHLMHLMGDRMLIILSRISDNTKGDR